MAVTEGYHMLPCQAPTLLALTDQSLPKLSLCADEQRTPRAEQMSCHRLFQAVASVALSHRLASLIGLSHFRGLVRKHREGLDFSLHWWIRCVLPNWISGLGEFPTVV